MVVPRSEKAAIVALLIASLAPRGAVAGEPEAASGSAPEEAGEPAAAPQAEPARGKDKDCALGFFVWCVLESDRYRGGAPSSFRLEGFGGYKFSNIYYQDEIRGCDAAGCELDFAGPAFGLDAYYNLSGDPRSDDYFALGIAASYIPIVTGIQNNTSGFQGENGRIGAGDGALAYVPIRLALRRSNFLYFIKSKYLVSAFGVGLAIPVSSGAGETFTGADSLKITLGGKIGAELPIADPIKLGIATNWSVIWYGDSFGEASFSSAYGLNVTYLL
jgi:hypothetical protein